MAKGTEVKRSICFWCNQRCRLLVHVKDNHLVKVKEEASPPPGVLSEFWLSPIGCERRAVAREIFYHPQRLTYPLKRAGERGEGKWQRLSWTQAMDEIAERIAGLKAKYGAETLATTRGTFRTADEYRSRFMNLFGSPNIIGNDQICYGPDTVVLKAFLGGFPTRFLSSKAKCIMVWASEPAQSSARMWRVMRNLKAKGDVKFICIDPRRGESAQMADLWLQPRPGTDCALALAMLNIIIKENLYDKEFVARWCLGFDKLKKRAAEFPVDKVEDITWVPADKIVQAARIYAQTQPGSIVTGQGIGESINNLETYHAVFLISTITRGMDVEGGMPLTGPHPQYIAEREIGMDEVLSPTQRKKQIGSERFRAYSWKSDELIQKEQVRVWGKATGEWSNDCQAHSPLVYRAMMTGEPYPVKALITLASNPMTKSTNVKLVYKALKSLDLHVVMGYWPNPTAELADYVLPAASWLERPYINDGLGNINLLTGSERALPATIEGEYDRRTDFDFWRELGIRLGQKKYWPWKTNEEAYDYRLAPLGLTFKEFMDKGGIEVGKFEFKKYEKVGFATPTGKVELASTILEKLDYDPLPVFMEPPESPVSTPELAIEYPLILVTGGRHRPYYLSEHHEIDSFRRKRPNPLIQINPKTAKELGIEDGDWVWIETPRGRIKQKCQYFAGIDPRVVHAEKGWWFPEEPGEEPWLHGCWWSNINVCTDDNPDICSPKMGAWPLRHGLCKVYKCKEYK